MYQGSIVALVTPFKQNYEVDFDAYGRLVDFHLEKGTDGIVPCGCTGEAATLSHDEQRQCIRFVTERVAGRVPVIAGTGSNNTKEAVSLARYASELKCDGTLSITPYYNKPTPAGQIAHYRAIAEAIDIPVMLYNVPGRTGISILPETVAELNKIPNIVSIKEASGSIDQVQLIRKLCDINIMSGEDHLTFPIMALGGTGVVSVAANVVPDRLHAMCAAVNNGDYAHARELHYELLPLFKGLFFETNPMPVKAALAAMGLIENVLRLPLTPMREEPWARLEKVLKDLAIL